MLRIRHVWSLKRPAAAVRVVLLSLLLAAAAVSGCSWAFWGGAAAGAAGAGAGYEISAKRQLEKLEEDYQAGNISKEEYEARKKQIEEGSIIY